MSAPTPGPWTVGQDTMNALEIVAEETEIATICSDEDLPEGDCEERANARLMAAAPDLREALQRFIDLSDHEYLGDDPRAVHAVKVARAAIAKAEGR